MFECLFVIKIECGDSTRTIGKYGESLAVKYLSGLNYKILKKNVYCRYGEIDIIASKDKRLHIIEVKYVNSGYFCDAVDLFNLRKQRHLKQTVRYFVNKWGINEAVVQVDLVCITNTRQKIWVEMFLNVL